MSDPIFLPGGRDARGTLDVGSEGRSETAAAVRSPDEASADACVVACPPDPQDGGHRGDGRLRAVSDELGDSGIDCLRFDYGAWDGGRGEREDALRAVAWAGERYDRVGLFGYSFGGAIALSAMARGADVVAVAALAPPARLGPARDDADAPPDGGGGVDTVADLVSIPDSIPIGIFYGTRDTVATVGPVVTVARERGAATCEFDSDHLFIGRERQVATAIVDFLAPALHAEESR